MLKSGLKLFSVFFFGFGLLLWLGMTLTDTNNIEGFANIQNSIADNSIALTVIRIILLSLLYKYWTTIYQWFGRKKDLEQEAIDLLIKSRNKIMMWMIAVEILIIQNVVGWLLEKYIL